MGQDLGVVFAPVSVLHRDVIAVVERAFAGSTAENIVVAIGESPSASPLARAFPQFTAFTVWADAEASLDTVAALLSRSVAGGRCLVLTAADHSCIGGWQHFQAGQLRGSGWAEGDDYLSIAFEGLALLTQEPLSCLCDDDRLYLVSSLAEPTEGYCLRTTSRLLKPGQPVAKRLLTRVTEDDIDNATFGCLLGGSA